MDGLIHAALEAEVILNRAKHVNTKLTNFDSSVSDHKMTWTQEKMHLAETVDESRMKFQKNSVSGATKTAEKFDLFKKLHELYNELSRDETSQANYQGLKTTSYLLEKLLATYNLNTLIINLYPGNKGYSLSLKINGTAQNINPPDANASSSQEETLIETPRWPYEEEELLSYIDNEELPVVLLDLLESEHSCLFYSGCIIAQIRDYRQAYPNFVCDTHHVLLRPTNQSIITDAMCIGRSGWAGEERGALEAVEAALVHAAAPPLCLEPRPAVGLLAARLHAAPRLFNTPRIRRQARRFSQVSVNRKRKLDQFTHYHGLELLELIHRQRAKNSRQTVPHTRLTSKFPKKPPEVFKPIEPPKMDPLPLALPSEPNAPLRLARAYERPRPTPDCQPQLVEEYILETEKTSPHAGAGFFHIKLSILQRPSDQEFLGELYVDRDHVEGEKNGAACRFSLGSRLQANKYIQQFTEIFTEEGRKSVRIKHIVPGQLPRVSFTGGMRDMQRTAQANNSTVQTHATTVPVVTSAIAATPNAHSNARQLPILQAQLQQVGNVNVTAVGTVVGTVGSVGTVGNVGSVGTVATVGNVVNVGPATGVTEALKQQPSPTTPRLSPQMQSAIIHIQHPLMSSSGTSQVQSIQYTNTTTNQQKTTITKARSTNPAINALVTSLMNSAQQFQQAASQNAAKAVVSTTSSNATILNLLNSAPAAMTHVTTSDSDTHKLLTRTVSIAGARLIASTGSHTLPTYTQQVMTGYTRENESTNVSSSESALLERLMGPEPASTPPSQTPQTAQQQPQPQPVCHLQGLSLTSLQGLQSIQGLQNVQVQIPGLSAPISLSLNVSGAPSGLLVSVPPTTSVVLTNQPSVLSLPIAQLMSGGVKGGVRSGSVQVVRAPRPARLVRPARPSLPNITNITNITNMTNIASTPGTTQFITQTQGQSQVLNAHQVRRKSNPDSS
ncbi:unnamed protein product [Danaus chrysippus]|uniref:(African queen) hypothetical protein n=1 Tax=Danaus chrysippus TaxID=151541 RepID=A0A8J2QI24_9NEOP|nr:unnamed protein product [Danaus chrysippus]